MLLQVHYLMSGLCNEHNESSYFLISNTFTAVHAGLIIVYATDVTTPALGNCTCTQAKTGFGCLNWLSELLKDFL